VRCFPVLGIPLIVAACADDRYPAEDADFDAARVACDVRVPGDQPTLQAGADAAPDGGVVCVGEGTFVGTLQLTDRTLTIRGRGPSRTILDADRTDSVVDLFMSTVELDGVTLTHGYADGGGAIAMGQTYLTLNDVTIADNEAVQSGGGIHATQGNIQADGVRFLRNKAGNSGGAIEVGEVYFAVKNSSFVGNRAATNDGGAIYAGRAGMWLGDVAFVGNRAGGQGGALAVWNAGGPLTRVVIAGNTAGVQGGGVYLAGYTDNQLTNVAIVGNRAPEGAGAVVTSDGYEADFDNAILAFNRPDAGHAAVWVYEHSYATFAYSDLWHNGTDVAGIDSPVGTDGNVAVDPEFVSYDRTKAARTWDLHLAAGSPVIDAGDPAILDDDGSPSDMGAYGGPAIP
jgi:predicted outer membrane repeat protein